MANLRAAPLRAGELVVPVQPLELPGVPLSCTADQPPIASRLLTLDAPAGTEPEPLTLTETSVTHEAPDIPQAFTCNVCPPAAADTVVEMDEDLMIVV